MITGHEHYIAKTLVDSASARKAVEAVDKVLAHLKSIEHLMSGSLVITSKEITISCPESIQEYSLVVKPNSRLINNDFRFKGRNVEKATIRPLLGLDSVTKAITIEDEDGGATIHLKNLDRNETYLLNLQYRIEDMKFVDSLVRTDKQIDSSDDDVGKYWISAELKHPEALSKSGYGRFEIRDIEFDVDVSIQEELNTAIPRRFKNQVELLAKLGGVRPSQDEYFGAARELWRLKGEYKEEELNLLSSLQDLFIPTHFKRFIDIQGGQFRYVKCSKGEGVYDLPINIWPKFMTVESRTDLNLENFAANGTIIYERNRFLQEVKKKFE